MKKTRLGVLPTLIVALVSGQANAAGIQLYDQNAAGLGNAYAGSAASTENASAVFYNPAGLTELPGSNFTGGLTYVTVDGKFTDQNSNTGALSGSGNGNNGTLSSTIPNAYFSTAISKDLVAGIGFYAPFGLHTDYKNPWVGAAQSLLFDVKSANLNPSIAYKLNDAVSLGFGLDWQRVDVQYTHLAGTYNGLVPPGIPFSSAGVLARLKVSDDAWGWNAGALFKLSPSTKLAVSYRSAVEHDLTGSVKLTSDGSVGGGIAQATLSALGGAGVAHAKLKLPDMWIFSGTHQLNDKWELLADVSHTGWTSMKKIDIVMSATGAVAQTLNLDSRDTWRVALGANYRLSDRVKLRFGAAYDQSPVHSDTTRNPGLPDSDRVWLSFGGQWKPAKETAVDLGLAYIRLNDPKINHDQTNPTNPLVGGGVLTGSYSIDAWVIGGQYSRTF